MQVSVLVKGYVKVYSTESPSGFMVNLKDFSKEIGVPDILVTDLHPHQNRKEVKDFCNKVWTTLRLLEQGTQWANPSELYVGLLK